MLNRSLLARFLRIEADNPELVHSQLRALRRHVPILYGILAANAAVFCVVHAGEFPMVVGFLIPAAIVLLAVARGLSWLKLDVAAMTHRSRLDALIETSISTPLLGVFFSLWIMLLFPHAHAVDRTHLMFHVALTVLGSGFCLIHLKSAAVSVPLSVGLPIAAYVLAIGDRHEIAMMLILAVVSAASVFMVWRHFDDFAALVDAKERLVAEQAETRHLSDENARLANLDSLTGLPNRRRFMTELDLAVEAGRPFVVGLVDLDGFKSVNDVYGHAMGDRLLVETSFRLGAMCGEDAMVARLGGDEFGLVLHGGRSDADLLDLGNQICETLQVPFSLSQITAQVSGSIGFASCPEAGTARDALFERADYALYHAKHNRRGGAVIFSQEHETEIREFSRLEQALRHADFEAELSLAFQPIHDSRDSRTIGFEALARWNSPTVGMIAPTDFIPVAERTNLIGRVTEAILRKALEEAARWPSGISLSVNLSFHDVGNPEAVLRIISAIMASGVDPRRIDLEVTESAMMNDFEHACDGLAALRRLGVRVSLDDFGTGYSSLSHLQRLPVDRIKIDRSFIYDLDSEQISRDILRTMADLCRNLTLGCVVEGVETEAQLQILYELGFTTVQGFYIGAPMPAEAIPDHLRTETASVERIEMFSELRSA